MNPDAHPLSASLRGGESGASYEILGKLATGGMAELFLARAPTQAGGRGPVVVLKRILPHLAEDPEFIRMFRDEAYLAATLRHPNIVQVFDIGREGEDYFFTMEYVHGENLRAILRAAQKRGESIPLTHILTIALGITAALHHAHEQTDDQGRPLHIVHRDVSPTNVLVAYDGSLKIVDFGIAKAAAGTHVTQAGMLKGKASYMSPEQCRAGTVDRRSDVFAIGILLYEMTTLTRLFKGENELAILHQVLSGAVERPSVRRPGYPPELERIVLKALAHEPDQRYADANALQADLMRFGQQNGLRPSTPALGQFLRGLFGNKPLPWQDEAPAAQPRAPRGNPDADVTVNRGTNRGANRGAPPSPPARAAAPQRPANPPPRPPRGPSARRPPSAKAWRPGGGQPPPPPSNTPRRGPIGPNTAKQVRLGAAAGAHASSRPTAPRNAPVQQRPQAPAPARPPRPRPAAAPARPAPAPARPAPAQGRPAPARPLSAAASYTPPPPDFDLDDRATEIAGEAFDPMNEAKTRVSGTTADDVRAFIAAAPAPDLGTDDDNTTARQQVEKTQVAPTSADAVRAFMAAAPAAQLAGGTQPPSANKTQVAPATAAEVAALVAAQKAAQEKAAQRDLFSAPAAPTRPGGKPTPAQTTIAAPSRNPGPRPPKSAAPMPAGLPKPPVAPAKPGMPAPSDLPPPGGAPQAQGPARRDTVMNAPAQPVALGGARRVSPLGAPPSGSNPVRAGQPEDLDEVATMRMTVDQATGGPVQQAARAEAAAVSTQPAAGMPGQPGMPPPMAPIAHWQQNPSPQQGVPAGNTVPMPMVDLEDEPLVVPGRNSKIIAMVVTIVVGLTIGAATVWFLLLDRA